MPRAYSVDMRERVIARSSGALRREAAEDVTISAPNAETGRCAVKAFGVGAHFRWRNMRTFCWS